MTRPLVILAALVPLHLLASACCSATSSPPSWLLPLLAVAAYEVADRPATRYAARRHHIEP